MKRKNIIMNDSRILNIVDENDKIIGEKARKEIHEKGLLHREVHVWLYNDNGELFFQKRAIDKETFPGLLDASVGGHVEMGDSYEKTAFKETEEETGLKINLENLKLITTIRYKAHDKITGKTNNVIRRIYAYKFNGSASDLKLEKGQAVSFKPVKIESLFKISDEEKKKFIDNLFDDINLDIFRKIKTLSGRL